MMRYTGVVAADHVGTLSATPAHPCAWCYREQHIAWPEHLSSSICSRHVAEEKAKLAARRAALAPEAGNASPLPGEDPAHDTDQG